MSTRAIQTEDDPIFAPTFDLPKFDKAPPRLKEIGNRITNLSYVEMLQLAEMLRPHITGTDPLTIANALVKTAQAIDGLPSAEKQEKKSETTHRRGY